MQTIENTPEQGFVYAFALQRQKLLHHVGGMLAEDQASADPATTRLSQTLLTSLELLKVAEEELREEQRNGAMRTMVHERRIAHLAALFDHAPAVLVLTTIDTTIREANKAAAALFGWDSHALEGRRLLDMVPADQRPGFREQLTQVLEAGTTAAWSFKLDVRRTLPAMVSASVHLIEDAAVGARALYWTLRAV